MTMNKNILKDSFLFSFPFVMLLFNFLCLVLELLMLSCMESLHYGNVFGLLMLATFLGNIKLAYGTDRCKAWGYGYLVLSFLFMLIIPVMNTLVSITPSNYSSQSMISRAAIFILFLTGECLAVKEVSPAKTKVILEAHGEIKTELSKITSNTDITKQNKLVNIITILLSLILFSGLFLVVFLLRERSQHGFIEMFTSEYALFYAIMFLSIGILIRKLPFVRRQIVYDTIILITVSLIFMVCLLPFVSTLILLNKTKNEYKSAFDKGFQTESEYIEKWFRQKPFSLTGYFYGFPSGDYEVQKNLLFYQGTEGVDQGLKLYYDVYTPKVDRKDAPGGRSVLIRIHGGGWTIGDKGFSNFAQMNKYFAAQGYVVFDIQYGLSNTEKFFDLFSVERSRMGNFTIDDMIRHIGIFTSYLVNHKEEYQIDLNSIFLTGGSAGGHLSLAAGLGLTNGGYPDFLNSEVKVKGIIPFYPANGLANLLGIEGSKEWVDTTSLIDSKSPPCLIYQGSHDSNVDPVITKQIQKTYRKAGNQKCAILTMPFAGHASDLYFSGYYNQVFLYYMERFMYQYR